MVITGHSATYTVNINDPVCNTSRFHQFINSNRLSLNTIVGVLLGLIFGLLTKWLVWPDNQQIDLYLLSYLSLPGKLYIRTYFLLIVPLLITSLATSFLNEQTDENDDTVVLHKTVNESTEEHVNLQRLLVVTFALFIVFSVSAACLGIVLVTLSQPGITKETVVNNESVIMNQNAITLRQKELSQKNNQMNSIYNILFNIFPENLLSSLFMTDFIRTEIIWPANRSRIIESDYMVQLKHQTTHIFKPNMLGMCALSLIFGIFLQKLGPRKTVTIRALLLETEEIVKYSMNLLLRLMPYGMFCWMFVETLKLRSMSQIATQMATFSIILTLAFLILLLVFYPLVYLIVVRENPYRLYTKIVSPILVALGSCSSALALPFTMEAMKSMNLSNTVANAVLPLGMTIHMNGTAMYYSMVAIFVAQMKNVQVDIFSMFMLGLFAVVMSMGLPAMPAGGAVIVNHIAFASVLGVENPLEVLTYILAFEWIWERIRTATNVIGDCFASKCIEKICVKKNKIPMQTAL